MRYLRIALKEKSELQLPVVPEELAFIQQIAKRHATTSGDLEHFYAIGVEVSQNFRLQTTEENYQSKAAWVVEQAIKAEKMKNIS